MITQILYSYFSLERLHALSGKIVELLQLKFAEQEMIATVLEPLAPQMATALKAIGSSKKQPLTPTIRLADRARDDSFISFKDTIKAGLRRHNEAYREACEALWSVIEKNNTKLYDLPDDDETSVIDSLIADLSTPRNQAYLALINATEWLNELDEDNKAFTATRVQRSVTRSSDDTVSDRRAFADLQSSLILMSNVLTSLYLVNKPEGIREAVAEINQYISEANAAAKQSR